MDHIVALDAMMKRGGLEPWISGLSVEANLRPLEYFKNTAKYNVVTPKDADNIERHMMRDLVKKGLANFKTVGKAALKGSTSGPVGAIGAVASLPFLMSASPRAQAAGETISAVTDPIGYGIFEGVNQLWKRRAQMDPDMPEWQRRLGDPTWGGALRKG